MIPVLATAQGTEVAVENQGVVPSVTDRKPVLVGNAGAEKKNPELTPHLPSGNKEHFVEHNARNDSSNNAAGVPRDNSFSENTTNVPDDNSTSCATSDNNASSGTAGVFDHNTTGHTAVDNAAGDTAGDSTSSKVVTGAPTNVIVEEDTKYATSNVSKDFHNALVEGATAFINEEQKKEIKELNLKIAKLQNGMQTLKQKMCKEVTGQENFNLKQSLKKIQDLIVECQSADIEDSLFMDKLGALLHENLQAHATFERELAQLKELKELKKKYKLLEDEQQSILDKNVLLENKVRSNVQHLKEVVKQVIADVENISPQLIQGIQIDFKANKLEDIEILKEVGTLVQQSVQTCIDLNNKLNLLNTEKENTWKTLKDELALAIEFVDSNDGPVTRGMITSKVNMNETDYSRFINMFGDLLKSSLERCVNEEMLEKEKKVVLANMKNQLDNQTELSETNEELLSSLHDFQTTLIPNQDNYTKVIDTLGKMAFSSYRIYVNSEKKYEKLCLHNKEQEKKTAQYVNSLCYTARELKKSNRRMSDYCGRMAIIVESFVNGFKSGVTWNTGGSYFNIYHTGEEDNDWGLVKHMIKHHYHPAHETYFCCRQPYDDHKYFGRNNFDACCRCNTGFAISLLTLKNHGTQSSNIIMKSTSTIKTWCIRVPVSVKHSKKINGEAKVKLETAFLQGQYEAKEEHEEKYVLAMVELDFNCKRSKPPGSDQGDFSKFYVLATSMFQTHRRLVCPNCVQKFIEEGKKKKGSAREMYWVAVEREIKHLMFLSNNATYSLEKNLPENKQMEENEMKNISDPIHSEIRSTLAELKEEIEYAIKYENEDIGKDLKEKRNNLWKTIQEIQSENNNSASESYTQSLKHAEEKLKQVEELLAPENYVNVQGLASKSDKLDNIFKQRLPVVSCGYPVLSSGFELTVTGLAAEDLNQIKKLGIIVLHNLKLIEKDSQKCTDTQPKHQNSMTVGGPATLSTMSKIHFVPNPDRSNHKAIQKNNVEIGCFPFIFD
ncbi:hypothetical protein BCR33DRAFT_750781 [Rhizoclosmatium globosum]|uniref:Uncharacterized protein n=1 Tax=Rhizoclosmatium globosum TaxID=329046 RepID=A0A1Y2AC46_9FUNG|nr:hypothetical protein BCR33DRAFT_750781 [Rhizoclosmatium globosum]|eukprot:ORY20076.1 hypothetical protein BCR33DRAFT_750781 [Rhizoclosmatium globosum]